MKVLVRNLFVLATLAGVFAGTSINVLLAENSTGNGKHCGALPEGATQRTNNADCKACKHGCQFAEDKFKICQDAGTGCTMSSTPDVKTCDGDLHTKTDCSDSIVGTCQDNYKYCE